MNSRERVLKAFKKDKGIPDRVPIQFDLCRQHIEFFSKKYQVPEDYSNSYYEDLTYRISANELRTKMGSDCVVVGGTIADDFVPEEISENISTNEFGLHMMPTNLYVEVVKCPLSKVESIEELEKYEFPDPYAKGRFTKAKRDIELYKNDYFVIGDVELSLFELAWHLVGMEKYMIDLFMESDWIYQLNDMVEAWTTGIAVQLVDLGVDAIWFGEDLGSQQSTLISPDMWRNEFKPRYARMINQLKDKNKDLLIIFHSDGAVAPLIPDFIEIGIDIYNPVQPNVPGSDPEELKTKFGQDICFFGGIDQQGLLPKGDLKAIRDEVRNRAKILGEDGGYLLAPAHILQADVSPDTIEALIQFVKEN
jgi:uroporphyrinogen decarboxylase